MNFSNRHKPFAVRLFFIIFVFAAHETAAQRTGNPQIKLPRRMLPKPVLEWQKFQANVKDYDDKPAIAAITFGFANREKYSNILFAPSPELPAGGANKSASRRRLKYSAETLMRHDA